LIFIIIRTHSIFCTYSLLESDVLAVILFTAINQIFKLRDMKLDAKKLLGFITNNVSLSIDVNSVCLLYTWPEANRSPMPDDSRPRHVFFLAANLVDSQRLSQALYFTSCTAKKCLVLNTFDCIRLYSVRVYTKI